MLASEALGALAEPFPDPIELGGNRPKPVMLLPVTAFARDGEKGGLLANQTLDASEQLELWRDRRQILDRCGRNSRPGEDVHGSLH
jgi:hypothetical protein